jgi:hypothetical protein
VWSQEIAFPIARDLATIRRLGLLRKVALGGLVKKVRSRAGILSVASLLVLGLTNATNSAHAVVASRLTGFSASTTTLRIDSNQVAFTGQMITPDGQPISGATVTLDAGYAGTSPTQVGSVSTGSNGSFSATVSFPHGAYAVEARFAGDGQYGAATSNWIRMSAVHAQVRFVMNPSPAQVVVTEPYAFSGTVQALWSDGIWHAVPGVRIEPQGRQAADNPVAASDGTFTVPIAHYYLIRPAYQLLAVDNLFGGFVNDYSEPLTLPSVLLPSRVDRFGAVPVPYPGNNQVRLTASIMEHFYDSDGSNQWQSIPWPTMQVWFRPRGSQTWTLVDTRNGGFANGVFTDTLTGYRDGTWQLRIPDQEGLLASSSSTLDVHTGVGTTFSGFKTSSTSVRRGHQFTLSGQLVAANKAILRKQPIKIYFMAKGSKKWVYAGSATTDQNAGFKRMFTAKASGTWSASYAGNSVDLSCASKGIYIHLT